MVSSKVKFIQSRTFRKNAFDPVLTITKAILSAILQPFYPRFTCIWRCKVFKYTQKSESSWKEGPAEVSARHQYPFPNARALLSKKIIVDPQF